MPAAQGSSGGSSAESEGEGGGNGSGAEYLARPHAVQQQVPVDLCITLGGEPMSDAAACCRCCVRLVGELLQRAQARPHLVQQQAPVEGPGHHAWR